jgi:hypothetical protein
MTNGDRPHVPRKLDRLLNDVVEDLSVPLPLTGRGSKKVAKQIVEAHFFRPANVDGRNATPCMPVVRVGNTGDVVVMDSSPAWWSSVYDPILHSGGYLLRVIARRRWTTPWRLVESSITPLLLTDE